MTTASSLRAPATPTGTAPAPAPAAPPAVRAIASADTIPDFNRVAMFMSLPLRHDPRRITEGGILVKNARRGQARPPSDSHDRGLWGQARPATVRPDRRCHEAVLPGRAEV